MLSCYDLVTASMKGDAKVVGILLTHSTRTPGYKHALLLACQNGHTEVVRLLLTPKDVTDDDDEYALRVASCNGHVGVVKLLLDHKTNVHTGKDYPLRTACEYGNTEVVRLLLEYGADVHTLDDYALRTAVEKGYVGVVSLLLEKGANVHAFRATNYPSMVKLFLSKGYYNSSMDPIITENFYDWIQEFPIPLDFKRTDAMEEVERRYLANENWIKGNRRSNYGFSDIVISMF